MRAAMIQKLMAMELQRKARALSKADASDLMGTPQQVLEAIARNAEAPLQSNYKAGTGNWLIPPTLNQIDPRPLAVALTAKREVALDAKKESPLRSNYSALAPLAAPTATKDPIKLPKKIYDGLESALYGTPSPERSDKPLYRDQVETYGAGYLQPVLGKKAPKPSKLEEIAQAVKKAQVPDRRKLPTSIDSLTQGYHLRERPTIRPYRPSYARGVPQEPQTQPPVRAKDLTERIEEASIPYQGRLIGYGDARYVPPEPMRDEAKFDQAKSSYSRADLSTGQMASILDSQVKYSASPIKPYVAGSVQGK